MTPGINQAKKAGIEFQIHEYEHDPAAASYGLEAAQKLNTQAERIFKTLIVQLDSKELAVGVVPVEKHLNLKAVASALQAKRADMADMALAERTTGYLAGGISPLGQKKRLRTIVDSSAQPFATMFVSAGRRGLEIELKPADLAKLTNATFADIARD